MGFTIYHNNAEERKLEKGVYEMIVSDCGFAQSQKGKEYLKFELTINEKVHPDLAGNSVNYTIFKAKNPSADDKACDGYLAWRVNRFARAANIPNGTTIETLMDLFEAVRYKPMKVWVGINEFNGREFLNVEDVARSEWTGEVDVFAMETDETATVEDLDGADIPW